MKVTIFGTGYVGLVQAAVLAETGYDVVCVDIDSAKIDALQRGEITLFEPGLEKLVRENSEAGNLRFTTSPEMGVRGRDMQIIAVGTPSGEDGSADLRHVLAAADSIAAHMEERKLIVVKSTVPVGTGDKVSSQIAMCLKERGRQDIGFDVASNPEFLKEGSAVDDCMRPDRIIIGVSSAEAEQALRELYAPFNRNHEKIIVMDVRSAELTKYAANCMLATRISFMNEIASLAEMLGADIERVRHGIGSDPRIGYHFIYPGLGYGGSCFPKDIRALIRTSEEIRFDASVLKAVEARNNRQKIVLVDKILHHFGGDISGRSFALWGVAFKPNTDDMREAPAKATLEALWAAGARVQVHDPKALNECRRIYGERNDLVLCETKEMALQGADALIVATEWKSFRVPDFDVMKSALKQPVIFDGRNVYDPAIATRHGFELYSVGRSARRPHVG
ncbi:UDP-glucose 6-dehydrogenase [Mesorhizobium sp. Root552]|uniref:UDP-glucose dehydrogenase family protein n=1 Tax=Mesorhizobium sp. Root552 TaxID=1736555 RepID=UPI0006FAAA31|nr:UDP-glucose/GDP-mannose dehydrogenase family protein [Mesorhizobium sp. Root552]KQZ16222.1 UDP-glucose 6-dehydrogenase [Mesorhizobium sp. Root552]